MKKASEKVPAKAELQEVKTGSSLNDVTSAVRKLQSLFTGLTARVERNEEELVSLVRVRGGKVLLVGKDAGADLVGTVDDLPMSEEEEAEEEERNRRRRNSQAKIKEVRRKERNADEHGGELLYGGRTEFTSVMQLTVELKGTSSTLRRSCESVDFVA